ncbi:MAG: hypothetical protein K0S34_2347 [Bacillales bacterium]|jgi:hypothetical protein|nr:hypothetical protein [Bacillales bacterium]
MKKRLENNMSTELISHLQNSNIVIVTTVDSEAKPVNRSVSWIYAISDKKIRMVVDSNSKILSSLHLNNNIAVTVFLNESVYQITGVAKLKKDNIEGIPFKVSMIEISVKQVENIMFFGSKLIKYPEYIKTNNEEKSKQLDEIIFKDMKEA